MDEGLHINSRWKQIRKVVHGLDSKSIEKVYVKQFGRSEQGRHQTLEVSGKLATPVIHIFGAIV